MKVPNLGPLPYFLGGVVVGILAGPAGDSGLAAIVSIVAAAFALSGPLLQERMRQGSEDRLVLRTERKDHAAEIADMTLRWLGGSRPSSLRGRSDSREARVVTLRTRVSYRLPGG